MVVVKRRREHYEMGADPFVDTWHNFLPLDHKDSGDDA